MGSSQKRNGTTCQCQRQGGTKSRHCACLVESECTHCHCHSANTVMTELSTWSMDCKQASMHAYKQASRQAGMHASKQASMHSSTFMNAAHGVWIASKQACMHTSKQACKHAQHIHERSSPVDNDEHPTPPHRPIHRNVDCGLEPFVNFPEPQRMRRLRCCC
jgi:hypothetical protein